MRLPLTLVSTPAGFGKTTLISKWRASGVGRDYPLACLSLENDDNDPTRFLTYVIAALGTLKPDLAETALGMLQSPQPPPLETFFIGLINDLDEFNHPFALVLDDYHVISATPVHEALGFLFDHLPPTCISFSSTGLTLPCLSLVCEPAINWSRFALMTYVSRPPSQQLSSTR